MNENINKMKKGPESRHCNIFIMAAAKAKAAFEAALTTEVDLGGSSSADSMNEITVSRRLRLAVTSGTPTKNPSGVFRISQVRSGLDEVPGEPART